MTQAGAADLQDDDVVEELAPTWPRVYAVYWELVWRACLVVSGGLLLLSFSPVAILLSPVLKSLSVILALGRSIPNPTTGGDPALRIVLVSRDLAWMLVALSLGAAGILFWIPRVLALRFPRLGFRLVLLPAGPEKPHAKGTGPGTPDQVEEVGELACEPGHARALWLAAVPESVAVIAGTWIVGMHLFTGQLLVARYIGVPAEHLYGLPTAVTCAVGSLVAKWGGVLAGAWPVRRLIGRPHLELGFRVAMISLPAKTTPGR